MIFSLRKKVEPQNNSFSKKVFRLLPYIFALVFIFGIFFPIHKAVAETNYDKCMYVENNEALCNSQDNPYGNPNDQISGSTTPTNPNSESAQTPTDAGGSCGWTEGMCWLAELSQVIMSIFAFILWASGTLLNLVINETVVKMAEGIKGMTGIDVTWRVIRDVVNIFFIFILVYEGILIIINKSNLDKAKQIIIGVVMTSVLMNFSVFFTKVIIDASNIATLGFYSSIEKAGQNTDQGVQVTADQKMNTGISAAFVNSLKISTLFDPNNIKALGGGSDKEAYKKIIILSLGASVLFLVLAFVFFAISAMFIIRYVTFIVLLMFSPLGFIFGIPALTKTQSDWWETLIGQAMFAPIYMFLTWVILTLISSPGFFSAPSGGFGDVFMGGAEGAASPSSMGLIINFVIIVALAIFSLTKAKEYANKGSSITSKGVGMMTSFAGGAILGGAAVAGRNTIGRIGQMASDSDKLKDAASKGGVSGMAARLALKSGAGAAKSTFDSRSSLGSLSDKLGVKTDFGKSGKATYKSVMDENIKSKVALADSLKSSKSAKAKEQFEEAKNAVTAKEKEIKDSAPKEEQAKKAYQDSDAYKNLQIAENKEKENNKTKRDTIKAEEDQKAKLDKELSDVEAKKKSASYLMDEAKRKEIDNEITVKKLEIENQKKKIEEVKAANIEETTATKAREDALNNFKSDERIKMEADLKELQSLKDEAEKEELELKTAYQERVKSYANTVENSWIKRYTTTILGGIAGAAVGGPIGAAVGTSLGKLAGGTKNENSIIASKIKATLNSKSDEAQLAELAAKIQKKKDDDENKNKPKTEEPEKTATPATTPKS